ncbi:DJ-1/PfpI family protein [Virgibacillus sp. FSP13]
MRKALLLIYDGFADFEVNLLSFFLKDKGYQVETFTIDTEKRLIIGESGFLIQPHTVIANIDDVGAYDVLGIPGGPIFDVMHDQALLKLVRQFYEKDKWLAAICAGTALLAEANVMAGIHFSTSLSEDEEDVRHIHDWNVKQEADVIVDQNIITAKGSAYVEFAVQVIKVLELFEPGEVNETLAYFKNQL